ncbi:MAG: 1-acyl-sn-glycerol-3-phosphate acyltransferase [Deltaproteobacteria bacterium]|nr:1-acyl-sn-glycerol-3-phosphate acyltransferase [Deltaproteobacteria bacterium]
MIFRTITTWFLGLITTISLFPFIIFTSIFDRSGNSAHLIGRFWAMTILFLSGVKVKMEGLENVANAPQIFISNHQGAFDILVLQAYLPAQFRWLAKKSLFKIPIIGWSMSIAGYVPIDRGHAGKAYHGLGKAGEKLKKGTSILIFPEGTRSRIDELLPFKRGGFALAANTAFPITPISIIGTRDIMKRGSIFIRPARVNVMIGNQIKTADVDDKALMEMARNTIQHNLKQYKMNN